MSFAILFHFLCTQHVSDINISIIRSLQLCCWITISVDLFFVRCVSEIWCGSVWVVTVLQGSACNAVFYSSATTMMHGPINIRLLKHFHYILVHLNCLVSIALLINFTFTVKVTQMKPPYLNELLILCHSRAIISFCNISRCVNLQ